MNTYQNLSNRLLGIAFIIAPLLLFSGAMAFLLGIGVTSYGTASWVEGVLMACAFMLFVPIYLALCRMLGERAPYLAVVCTAFSVGIGFGVIPATDRILQAALDANGYDIPIFSIQHAGSTPILIWTALGLLLSPLLLGVGFLWKGGVPRWTAALLLAAPFLFVLGQGGDETIAWWQVNIMYPLATVVWFLALAPIGWRLLSGTAAVKTAIPQAGVAR